MLDAAAVQLGHGLPGLLLRPGGLRLPGGPRVADLGQRRPPLRELVGQDLG